MIEPEQIVDAEWAEWYRLTPVERWLEQLGIEPGDTTPDGQITVECVNCVGACALGPIVIHNDSYCKDMTPGKLCKKFDKAAGKKKEAKDA